jgi:hypothetical protein
MKTYFVVFVLSAALIAGPVFASSEGTTIEVINVDVGAGTETLIATLTPEDFKGVQVIRHSYGYGAGNYETRGILIDSNSARWDGYWDDNQGYSIKTVINGVVSEEGRLVVGSIDYVPFGFSTKQEAMEKAQKITDAPIFIDLAQQEKARADKKEAEEVARMHKESVDAKERFESADSWHSGRGSGPGSGLKS